MAGCPCCSGEPCANCSPTKVPTTLHATFASPTTNSGQTLPAGTYPLVYGSCAQVPTAWIYVYVNSAGGYQITLAFVCTNSGGPVDTGFSMSVEGIGPSCLGSPFLFSDGETNLAWDVATCSPPDWYNAANDVTISA